MYNYDYISRIHYARPRECRCKGSVHSQRLYALARKVYLLYESVRNSLRITVLCVLAFMCVRADALGSTSSLVQVTGETDETRQLAPTRDREI